MKTVIVAFMLLLNNILYLSKHCNSANKENKRDKL